MITDASIPTENQEQRQLVRWLFDHPILNKFFCKNNNEGKRTPIQGRHLKLMGMRPGVSDLFIYYPTSQYYGLWLEVKRNMHYPPSAMRTDTWLAQIEFIKNVKSVGFAGEFCYGFQDGKRIIESYLLSSL